ncbi:MAG: hypothetical protein ACOCUT_01470 [bacterium]
MKEIEVITEIGKLIESYRSNYATLNISQLMNFRDKLATYSYNLAEISADAKDDYNTNLYVNRIEFNRAKQHYMNEGNTGTKAEALASTDTEESLKNKLGAESWGYRADALLKQVNKVLDSVGQRISVLKKEWEKNN